MVRQIKEPPSIPAVLPHGPLPEQPPEPDDLAELDATIDDNYKSLAADTARILLQLQGDDNDKETKHINHRGWDQGVRFRWKNIADQPASDDARTTPVSRAWRNIAAWLRIVIADRSKHLKQSAVWKLVH